MILEVFEEFSLILRLKLLTLLADIGPEYKLFQVECKHQRINFLVSI